MFFFFNDTATTEIYTLSLHDALPIFSFMRNAFKALAVCAVLLASASTASAQVSIGISIGPPPPPRADGDLSRSEEHTSELQSQSNLVCRLLLEKKKNHEQSDRASIRY